MGGGAVGQGRGGACSAELLTYRDVDGAITRILAVHFHRNVGCGVAAYIQAIGGNLRLGHLGHSV